MSNKVEAYEIKTIHRRQINPAPYNPRFIDRHARKKLSESIEYFGILEDLVWNEVTGNLVGGHQRLNLLDDLEGHQDYTVDVSAISISDLKKEKALNVLLNNPEIQGHFNSAMLSEMIAEIGVKHTAFDHVDLQMLGVNVSNSVFGQTDSQIPVADNLVHIHQEALALRKATATSTAKPENQPDQSSDLEDPIESPIEGDDAATEPEVNPEAQQEKKRAPDGTMKAREQAFAVKAAQKDFERENYIVLVMPSQASKAKLLKLLNYPPMEDAIDGDALAKQMNEAASRKGL